MIEIEFFFAMMLGGVVTALVLLRAKKSAERRLRGAIEALPAGIAFYDTSDRLYLWNQAFAGVAGLDGKALRRGVPFRQLLEGQLRDGHYAEARGREGEWLEARMALRAKGEGAREQDLQDGRWLRVQDRRTPDGETVSICADITDIKRGEDSFKLMFDTNPVPMWLWEGSKALNLVDLNQAALDHLGYARADIAGLSVFDLLSAEERPALNAMIASGVVRPYDGERIWRPRHKDGSLRYAVPYIQILPAKGRPHFVGAIVDVTERVSAERELRRNADALSEALGRAEAANKTKSAFLAAMSHELRTPLNAVLGFSEILQRQMFGPIGNARYLDYAQSIHSSGSHLLGLINDILDLSRLDSCQLELHFEAVDLAALVADCVKSLALQAEKEQLRITSDVEAVFLKADARRLRQMLLNLLSNAVKFTPEGGTVRVTTARETDGFALAVSDSGIGMAPQDIPKALERFGQIDSSLGRKYEGTGLGLPLTKEMAELHGATLTIASTQGAGTTVTILFPAASVVVGACVQARAS